MKISSVTLGILICTLMVCVSIGSAEDHVTQQQMESEHSDTHQTTAYDNQPNSENESSLNDKEEEHDEPNAHNSVTEQHNDNNMEHTTSQEDNQLNDHPPDMNQDTNGQHQEPPEAMQHLDEHDQTSSDTHTEQQQKDPSDETAQHQPEHNEGQDHTTSEHSTENDTRDHFKAASEQSAEDHHPPSNSHETDTQSHDDEPTAVHASQEELNAERSIRASRAKRKISKSNEFEDDDVDEGNDLERDTIYTSAWQPSHVLAFKLDDSEEVTLFEDVEDEEEGVVIRGDFYVSGGDHTVSFRIIDPEGVPLYEVEEQTQGDFKFYANPGVYTFEFSASSQRVVVLALLKGLDEDDGLWKYARQADTDEIVRRISALHQHLDPIVAEQSFLNARYRRHQETQESTNTRIVVMTILEMIATLFVTIVQVVFIRSLNYQTTWGFGKSAV